MGKATGLMEANAALKVLLKQRESDKADFEERISSNVKILVLPYIEKLKKIKLESNASEYINILETNLMNIISEFSFKLSSKHLGLTPKEIQVANFIREGKQSKDISEILHLSFETINSHRRNIRKKLGLKNKKINLRSYFLSLAD